MYERHEGDDLLSDDPRLKSKWGWNRSANGLAKEEQALWTHFQVSESTIGDWKLSVTQWGEDTIYYEPTIEYQNDDRSIFLTGHEFGEEPSVIETRIEAQIKAEEILAVWITDAEKRIVGWIRKEYKLIMDVMWWRKIRTIIEGRREDRE